MFLHFLFLYVLHSIALTHCSRLLGVFTAISLYFAISCYIICLSCRLMLIVVSCSLSAFSCSSLLSRARFLLSHACPCLLVLHSAFSYLSLPSRAHCNSFLTWDLAFVPVSRSRLCLRLGVSPPSSTWYLNSVSESRRVLYSPCTIDSSSQHEKHHVLDMGH